MIRIWEGREGQELVTAQCACVRLWSLFSFLSRQFFCAHEHYGKQMFRQRCNVVLTYNLAVQPFSHLFGSPRGGDCLFLAMPGKTVFKNYPPVAKVGELAWSKLVTGFYNLNTMTRLF